MLHSAEKAEMPTRYLGGALEMLTKRIQTVLGALGKGHKVTFRVNTCIIVTCMVLVKMGPNRFPPHVSDFRNYDTNSEQVLKQTF